MDSDELEGRRSKADKNKGGKMLHKIFARMTIAVGLYSREGAELDCLNVVLHKACGCSP